MQRISLLVATLILALCLTNGYAAEENQSESESCWVIVKETYEWITDDEEMAAMHYVVSNLTYDSEPPFLIDIAPCSISTPSEPST